MSRTHLLSALLLALLVTTAGCSGLLGGATTPAGTTDGPDATETSPTATHASVAALDLETLRERHTGGLREAGSFNATRTVTISSNDTSTPFSSFSLTSEYAVDFERNRSIERSSLFGTTVTYTAANGTTYRKQSFSADAPPEQASYTVSAPGEGGFLSVDPVNVTEAIGADAFVVGENVTYEAVGTETREGVSVTRYEADGIESLTGDGLLGNGTIEGENASIERFTATLLVDGEGVVRHSEWHVEFVDTANATAYELGIRHDVSAVGEVSIAEPGWLRYVDERDGSLLETPTNCSTPTADGTLAQSPAADGTYNVTFEAETLGEDAVVRLQYEDAGYENYLTRTAYFEGDTARATGLAPGAVVEAVAENGCEETVVVATHTVVASEDESTGSSAAN